MIGFNQLSKRFESDTGLGRLLAVSLIRTHQPLTADDLLNGEDLEAFVFSLEHCEFYCLAKGEDDQLEVHFQMPFLASALEKIDISTRQPWASVLGTELFSAWSLQANGGYYDALQFMFAPIDDSKHLIVQLEVAASMFRVAVVCPVEDMGV